MLAVAGGDVRRLPPFAKELVEDWEVIASSREQRPKREMKIGAVAEVDPAQRSGGVDGFRRSDHQSTLPQPAAECREPVDGVRALGHRSPSGGVVREGLGATLGEGATHVTEVGFVLEHAAERGVDDRIVESVAA